MVNSEDFNTSTDGSREIIDGRDLTPPYSIFNRHGSSDHVQHNFPTPGEIRSMFNTAKISDRPEYASSPSTMSDPLEWRPMTPVELLEEKLMRIHRWTKNISYDRRPPYEAHSVTITNVNGFGGNTENSVYGFQSPNIDILCGVDDITTMHGFGNEYENQSEKSIKSDQTKDDDDEHREYDVEEYIDQNNVFTDASENSFQVLNVEYSNKGASVSQTVQTTIKSEQVTDFPDSFERQKQLEKFFNLNVKDNDNAFTGELKSLLLDKLKKYLIQKTRSTFGDDIKQVGEILSRTINDKDSVICDKVHELCLCLRDILVLKDNILSNATNEYAHNGFLFSELDTTDSAATNSIYTPDNVSNDDHTVSIQNSMRNIDEIGLEGISNEKITMIHTFNKESDTKIQKNKNESPKRESFEVLSKYSRIPILMKKSTKNSDKKPPNTTKKFGSKISTTKATINSKPGHEMSSGQQENHSQLSKRVSTKHRKDILQQKEAILKQAELLGLIGAIDNVGRIPHLTERAQLALLDKQIQGKLKNKQLSLERRKVGLRDRVITPNVINTNSSQIFSNINLNSQSSESNTNKQKISNIPISVKTNPDKSNIDTVVESNYERPRTQPSNKTRMGDSTDNIEQTLSQRDDVTTLHTEVNEEVLQNHELNKIEVNIVQCDPPQLNVQDFCGFNKKCMQSKLTISSLGTWSSDTNAPYFNPWEDDIHEDIKDNFVWDTDEIEMEMLGEMPTLRLIPIENLLSSVEKTEEWERKLQEDTPSEITSDTLERNSITFKMFVCLLVVVVGGIVLLLNQKQIYEFLNEFIYNDPWDKITNFDLRDESLKVVNNVRKYLRNKCELI